MKANSFSNIDDDLPEALLLFFESHDDHVSIASTMFGEIMVCKV